MLSYVLWAPPSLFLQLAHKQQELKTLKQKYAESQSQLLQTTAQLDSLRSNYNQVKLEVM